MTGQAKKKPLARSLGEFFGILWQAAKTDVTKPPHSPPGPPAGPAVPGVVRTDVQERAVQTPQGTVILRRTTIDEVVPAARTGGDRARG